MKKFISGTFIFLQACIVAYSQSWFQKASLPLGKGELAPVAFSINGKLYVGGGYNGSSAMVSFYEYNPNSDTWTPKANLPSPVYSASCFVLNTKGYVVCGADPQLTRNVFEYDPVSDTWAIKNNFPSLPRMNLTGFSLNGRGYLFGGFVGSNTSMSDMWEYDQATDSWIAKANCPGTTRNGPASFVINGKAYVGLGCNYNGTINYSDMYEFNPVTNSYNAISNLPAGRNSVADFSIGNFGYVGVGNSNSGGLIYPLNFWRYDPSLDTWNSLPDFNGPAKAHVFSETVGNKPYIGCGDNATGSIGYMNDNWTWDSCSFFIDLGSDTSICHGQTLSLNAGNTGASFSWSNGNTSSSITVSAANVYWLDVTQNGCTKRDSIRVTVEHAPSPFSLGTDTSFCSNLSIILATGNNNTLWSNGFTGSQILVNNAGVYTATISNKCGSFTDTIIVTQLSTSPVDIGNDTTLCIGQNLLLDANCFGCTYLWSDNSTAAILNVNEIGIYTVTITSSSGCTATDNVVVNYSSQPPTFSLGSDIKTCEQQITLSVPIANRNYYWSTSATDSFILIYQSGSYSITVSDGCGSATDEINVLIYENECNINIPTAFSPNADGVNDLFRAIVFCPVKDFELMIYNRWGEKVYQSSNISDSWDGTFKNSAQPMGVYVYACKYFNQCSTKIEILNGNLTLIR